MTKQPTIHSVNKFIGLVATACVNYDWDLVRSSFKGMSPAVKAALAQQVADYIERNCEPHIWLEAVYHLPTEYNQVLGGAPLSQFPAIKAALVPPRTALARHAFRLLRSGVGAVGLADQIRVLNDSLVFPLSGQKLDELLIWVVQRHMRGSNGAVAATNAG